MAVDTADDILAVAYTQVRAAPSAAIQNKEFCIHHVDRSNIYAQLFVSHVPANMMQSVVGRLENCCRDRLLQPARADGLPVTRSIPIRCSAFLLLQPCLWIALYAHGWFNAPRRTHRVTPVI
jgi:hypothetical protein